MTACVLTNRSWMILEISTPMLSITCAKHHAPAISPDRLTLQSIQQPVTRWIKLEQSTLTATQAPNKSTTDVSLAVRTQDCPVYQSTYSRGDELMEYFETKWQCTGWCANTGSLFYRFTDVNNGKELINEGKPRFTCFSRVSERIRHYTRVIYAIAFTLMSLFILGWILALCLCCTMRRGSRYGGNTYGVPYPVATPVASPAPIVSAVPVSQAAIAQSGVSYGY